MIVKGQGMVSISDKVWARPDEMEPLLWGLACKIHDTPELVFSEERVSEGSSALPAGEGYVVEGCGARASQSGGGWSGAPLGQSADVGESTDLASRHLRAISARVPGSQGGRRIYSMAHSPH